jgi:hypothetical protein
MTDVPAWLIYSWIVISGLCFLFSLLLNGVLLYVVITKVLPLITDVSKQVSTIGQKVTDITTSAKTTVDTIQGKTVHILGSAEEASVEVAKKVSAASAAITAIYVVTRLVGALRSMHQQNPPPVKIQTVKVPVGRK